MLLLKVNLKTKTVIILQPKFKSEAILPSSQVYGTPLKTYSRKFKHYALNFYCLGFD